MSGTTLKPWTKLVRLREDVRSGELSLQEFAADLFDVVNRTGKRPIYEQPARFFPLTFATTGLRDIVAGTAERLRGKSAKAIRQMAMAYGGGKTHTLVTLTHIFRDPEALPDVPSVHEFQSAMGGKAPKSRVSAVCFDKLDLESGIRAIAPDGSARMLRHAWSVIAFQLAGADGLRALHPNGEDAERDTPPWWRTRVDETALADDNLEAVQNSAATLESLDPGLLAPGVLEGLTWANGVKVSDLVPQPGPRLKGLTETLFRSLDSVTMASWIQGAQYSVC